MAVPLLRLGSSGPLVRDLQTALNAALLPSPNLSADGVFGTQTDVAVRRFQTFRRVPADGVVGPITQCVLRGGRRPPPTIHNVTLIPQPTNQTCWAAATAMMKNSTPQAIIAATPADLILADGSVRNFSEGADNVSGNQRFARVHGLRYHAPQSWSVPGFVGLMRSGPVMLDILWNIAGYTGGQGSSGHMVVVFGIDSDNDGTGAGTLLHIRDPWRPRVGATVRRSYLDLITSVPGLTYGVFQR